MSTPTRPTETYAQALRRLATKAQSTGITVFQYEPTREWYSNSRRAPHTLHRVTLISCDCLAFQHYQRCSHFAALLDHLDELPTDPGPEPTPVVVSQAAPAQIGPVIYCRSCGEVMQHVIATYFECACGRTFEVDAQTADLLDAELSTLIRSDPGTLREVVRLLSPDGDVPPDGWDPDNCPGRQDAPAFLDRYNVSADEVAAVLVWQTTRQPILDRIAA